MELKPENKICLKQKCPSNMVPLNPTIIRVTMSFTLIQSSQFENWRWVKFCLCHVQNFLGLSKTDLKAIIYFNHSLFKAETQSWNLAKWTSYDSRKRPLVYNSTKNLHLAKRCMHHQYLFLLAKTNYLAFNFLTKILRMSEVFSFCVREWDMTKLSEPHAKYVRLESFANTFFSEIILTYTHWKLFRTISCNTPLKCNEDSQYR